MCINSKYKTDAAIVQELKGIAKVAGKQILEIYEQPFESDIDFKSDESPLTRADVAANRLICERLQELTPDIPIISEENKLIPYEVRRNYTRFWLVDPLDGTKEFIKRNGEFTVNIALVEDQESIVGIVRQPTTGTTWWAAKGHGAWRIDVAGERQIRSATFNWDDSGLGVVCSRSHLDNQTQAFIATLKDPQVVSCGSSLKILTLAEGKAHLYPRLGPTMEWDTAAAHIVLTESGGKVVIYGDESRSLCYNKESLLNPPFLATGKEKI